MFDLKGGKGGRRSKKRRESRNFATVFSSCSLMTQTHDSVIISVITYGCVTIQY